MHPACLFNGGYPRRGKTVQGIALFCLPGDALGFGTALGFGATLCCAD